MDGHVSANPATAVSRQPARLIVALLAAGALVHLALVVWLGLGREDSENLETTRVLAAARPLRQGPAALYGPYGADDPYVLIQAPLYYRATAWGARLLAPITPDPVAACFVAGRALAFLAYLGTLALTYRLARLAGGTPRAGLVAMLLLLGTPLVATYPVTVRPDIPGILLQTLGLVLAIEGLARRPRGAKLWLAGSFVAFGLAFAVKQHLVVIAAAVAAWLVLETLRGRLGWTPLIAAGASGLAPVAGYYGLEEWATGGLMGQSCFAIPGALRDVNPGSWPYVGFVFLTTAKRGIGLLGVAGVVTLGLLILRLRHNTETRGRWAAPGVTAALLVLLAADLALMAKLCLDSSGAWFNYALQAAVLGSVLLGVGLVRLLDQPAPALLRLGLALAAVLVLADDLRMARLQVRLRLESRRLEAALLADARLKAVPARARYFSGSLQHYNERHGRVELAHDEWLYTAFERVAAAEPRSRWLRQALQDGTLGLVVTNASDGNPLDQVAGVPITLDDLGFSEVGSVEGFHLWMLQTAPSVAARRQQARDRQTRH